MKNTREDILHLAKLSNLSLEETEVEGLQRDLDNIVGYISQLDELMSGERMKSNHKMLPENSF